MGSVMALRGIGLIKGFGIFFIKDILYVQSKKKLGESSSTYIVICIHSSCKG